jgi:hypothetical protein
MNESNQKLFQSLLQQIKEKDDMIARFVKATQLQGLINKKKEKRFKKYKTTTLFLAILLSISIVINILLLLK